jgi:hypothetical protein
MSRSQYGNSTFDYPVFSDQPYTSYKDLVIRSQGQDHGYARIRDDLMYNLIKGDPSVDVDVQDHEQCIVFINGQFWGVYDLMEKLNEHFVAQHHDVDSKKVNLLVGNGSAVDGSNADYKALVNYVKTHDMSNEANYNYVASKMDIDSYIDYCCIETFTDNSDLGNIKYWKSQDADGKWRWIFYDADMCYFFVNPDQAHFSYYANPFERFLDPRGNGINHIVNNTLALKLLDNPTFKQKFLQRFAHFCTVTFDSQKALNIVNTLVSNIQTYMPRDEAKWGGSTASWMSKVQIVKDFATKRPRMNEQCMKEYFHLSDAQMRQLIPGWK